MAYQIHPDLSFCLFEGMPVFLDLKRDRYFALGERLGRTFCGVLNGQAPPDLPADELVSQGILSQVQGDAPPKPASVVLPHESVPEMHHATGGLMLALSIEIGAHILGVRRRMKRDGLAAAIDRQRKRNASIAKREESRNSMAITLSRRFISARRWVPIQPICLADSLALLEFLGRRSVAANLVIGVKMKPFAAHCWVQTDETILNEEVGFASTFKPILVA